MIPHSRPWLTGEDHAAMRTCLASGQLASGALAEHFAHQVGQYVGTRSARSAPNGTTALIAALRHVGVGAGDHVVLPTYVCIDVEHAVRAVGAEPRFADVGDDGTLTHDTVERAMSPRTRAIVAVHVFGHPCALAPLRPLGMPIVEDACQAFAFDLPEGRAGTLGDVGVYSFHATKCLTSGEGGMLVSQDEIGTGKSADCPSVSDLQAALGLAQLARYDAFLKRRRGIRTRYEAALSGREERSRRPAGDLFRFTFTLAADISFDAAAAHFAGKAISLRRGVDALLHRAHGLPDTMFPGACALYARNASVPFYPALSDAEVATIADALADYDGVA